VSRALACLLALSFAVGVALASVRAWAADEEKPAEETSEPKDKDQEKKEEKEKKEEEERSRKQPRLSTPYDDTRVGKEAAEQARAAMGLIEDEAMVEYVRKIGARLARYAPGPRFDYHFDVIDQEVPNAFALPGGSIFISRGLLELANSEDELACVIGHEIVHAASRHAAARQQMVKQVPGFFQFMQQPSLAAYGRDQERAADRLGQGLAGLAGYDPKGMATFLKQLEFMERLRRGSSRMPGFMDTHPGTLQRVSLASTRASNISWTPKPSIAGSPDAYLRMLDGMPLGVPAREGVFKRDRFLHADLGFTLRFPTGWETMNSHTAVGAISRERDAQLVLEGSGGGEDARAAAEAFLKGPEMRPLNVEREEPVQVAGQQAWRVTGHVSSGRGGMHVTITFIPWRGSVFRLTGIALNKRYEGVFVNAARSFRPMTPALLAQVTERKLRVVEAEPGETLEALSRRTKNKWKPNETAVMNALFTNSTLEGGQLVKIMREEKYVPQGADG
jgi:predicted Zn-dependent protease